VNIGHSGEQRCRLIGNDRLHGVTSHAGIRTGGLSWPFRSDVNGILVYFVS
jgi:hypothetical protein